MWTDPKSLGVKVTEGVVTLTGVVSKHTEAFAAVSMAESIDGVVAVHDELTWSTTTSSKSRCGARPDRRRSHVT